ncbi:hypothetical protein P7K49_012161 [Saguinus oedipus]|uniref:Uncharacterized protein n=1 Tax=Saguinus oedipus TaxID=9490 RepID=A0ABQ9VSQ9_SAGOE|nr:hypothetical protein P7K49_012161 [Saguinus oedipus]
MPAASQAICLWVLLQGLSKGGLVEAKDQGELVLHIRPAAQPPQTLSMHQLQRKLKEAARKILSLRLEKEQLIEMGNRLRAELGHPEGESRKWGPWPGYGQEGLRERRNPCVSGASSKATAQQGLISAPSALRMHLAGSICENNATVNTSDGAARDHRRWVGGQVPKETSVTDEDLAGLSGNPGAGIQLIARFFCVSDESAGVQTLECRAAVKCQGELCPHSAFHAVTMQPRLPTKLQSAVD